MAETGDLSAPDGEGAPGSDWMAVGRDLLVPRNRWFTLNNTTLSFCCLKGLGCVSQVWDYVTPDRV